MGNLSITRNKVTLNTQAPRLRRCATLASYGVGAASTILLRSTPDVVDILCRSRTQKNSPILGAVLEELGSFETPSPSRISRNVLWC
jgi:hypothetical protein